MSLRYAVPMEIEYAVLADYAELVAGKLYLMGGGWDTSNVSEVPTGVRCAVAVGVRIAWEDIGTHFPLLVIVEDDDGQEFVRLAAEMVASHAPHLPPGSSQLSQLAANLPLTLPRAGGYRVHITVGEGALMRERSLPFRVALRPVQA